MPLDEPFPLASATVVRPRLHERLAAGGPCTLVSAPAGWGKTVLVSSWRADAAVVRLLPGADAGETLPDRIAAVLADREGPTVLLLDDLHEVTSPAVHQSLLRLVTDLQDGVCVVVATRRDPPWPLNRLRLAGVLSEIRAPGLAFRTEEARALLAGLGLRLAPADLDRLVVRTDGWAAGIRLAAVGLPGAADPAAVVSAFSGDDHAMAAYLLKEVLDGLTPELLGFAARISVVDEVCAELADALTGGRDGAVALAALAEANLVVQADGGHRWYRLHRLVADILRPRLVRRRTVRELHRRAAEWYLRHGMPYDAIRYALRGELWPFAAEMLGVHLLSLGVRDGFRDVDALLTAAPRSTVLGHPELAAALATARIMQGSPAELGVLTAAAHAGTDGLPAPRARRLRVVLDLMEIGNGRAAGDLARVAEGCRRVPSDPATLAGLGLAGWDVVPLLVLGNAGTAELWTGDLVEAEKHLRAAVDVDRDGMVRPRLNAAAHLALLQHELGDLGVAAAAALAVVAQATAAGWGVSAQVVAAYLALAGVAVDRDDGAGADDWLARVAAVEAQIPEPHVQLAAAGLTAVRRADAGDWPGALSGLQRAAASTGGHTPAALTDRIALLEADLLCRMGDLAAARTVLAARRGAATARSARATARLEWCAGDRAAADAALAPFPDDGGTVRGQVEGAVLRSVLAADRAQALSEVDIALRVAGPVELRRPFLDRAAELAPLLAERVELGTASAAFAEDLLRRMADDRVPSATAVALTDRERLVLRYLAGTLSNAEMAAELHLSVNTVKTHQRTVYRKLGAAGRRDAVRRGKELRLL